MLIFYITHLFTPISFLENPKKEISKIKAQNTEVQIMDQNVRKTKKMEGLIGNSSDKDSNFMV